jgi:hypothetical protein
MYLYFPDTPRICAKATTRLVQAFRPFFLTNFLLVSLHLTQRHSLTYYAGLHTDTDRAAQKSMTALDARRLFTDANSLFWTLSIVQIKTKHTTFRMPAPVPSSDKEAPNLVDPPKNEDMRLRKDQVHV